MNHQPRKEVPCCPIIPQGTLATALASLPDPRHPFGWRPDHPPLPLVSLLLLTLAAMLSGANSLSAIVQWGRERLDDQPERLLSLGFPAQHRSSTLHRISIITRAILGWLTTLGMTVANCPSDEMALIFDKNHLTLFTSQVTMNLEVKVSYFSC